MRVCAVGRDRIGQWLEKVQRNLDRKRVYAHTPIEHIEGWIGVENLFDSVLVFDRRDGARGAGPALASQACATQTRVALELVVRIGSDGLRFDLLYKASGDRRDAMATVLEQFMVLLEGPARNPDRNPATLAMRTKSEGREGFWKTLNGVGGK